MAWNDVQLFEISDISSCATRNRCAAAHIDDGKDLYYLTTLFLGPEQHPAHDKKQHTTEVKGMIRSNGKSSPRHAMETLWNPKDNREPDLAKMHLWLRTIDCGAVLDRGVRLFLTTRKCEKLGYFPSRGTDLKIARYRVLDDLFLRLLLPWKILELYRHHRASLSYVRSHQDGTVVYLGNPVLQFLTELDEYSRVASAQTPLSWLLWLPQGGMATRYEASWLPRVYESRSRMLGITEIFASLSGLLKQYCDSPLSFGLLRRSGVSRDQDLEDNRKGFRTLHKYFETRRQSWKRRFLLFKSLTMIEAETAMVKYADADLPSVSSLSIPAKKQNLNVEWTVNKPMLVGMISGVALTLCIANLIAFMLNLMLAGLVIITLVQPSSLKSVASQAVKKLTYRTGSDFSGNPRPRSPAQSVLQSTKSNLPIDYQPFEAEVAMIMDVAEEFSYGELRLKAVSADQQLVKIAQEIMVEGIPFVEFRKEQYIHRYQEVRIEKVIQSEDFEEEVEEGEDEEDELFLSQDDQLLMDHDLGRFSAEDYTNEIDDLYRQAFHGAPRISDIIW